MSANDNRGRIGDIKKQNTKSQRFNTILDKVKEILPTDVLKNITDEMEIPPRVALIGKSGVGKTTTINSLFDADWHTSEVVTGTTTAQEETLQLADGSQLTIVDMPGLGDSIENDRKFIEIYKEELPKVDVILYLIQADDEAIGEDIRIINEIISQCGAGIKKKLAVGINKVDLLGKGEGEDFQWNEQINLPSEKQEILIKEKSESIVKALEKRSGLKKKSIVYYSAKKRYHLYDLLDAIIMQSGVKGWKISVAPKDWLELCDPKIQKILKETKESESYGGKIYS